jgi:hypothetical protein
MAGVFVLREQVDDRHAAEADQTNHHPLKPVEPNWVHTTELGSFASEVLDAFESGSERVSVWIGQCCKQRNNRLGARKDPPVMTGQGPSLWLPVRPHRRGAARSPRRGRPAFVISCVLTSSLAP